MPRKLDRDSLPSDKLLMLYQRLTLDPRRHYLGDVARDLVCSPQTVVRLMSVIERHLGADVGLESGLEGRRRYYRLRARSERRTFGFGFEELHHLALCRDLSGHLLSEGVRERIDASLMALALHLGAQSLPRTSMSFRGKGRIDYTPHLDVITALRHAIAKRQVCDVTYHPVGRREPIGYRYAPGRLIVMSDALYVEGRQLETGSLLPGRATTFLVHRLRTLRPTGEYFSFSAADGDDGHFGLSWHPPRRVAVHVQPPAADYVRDRVWSEGQAIIEHPDGALTLSVTTTSEKELQAWVWSFGGQARLVGEQTTISENQNDETGYSADHSL